MVVFLVESNGGNSCHQIGRAMGGYWWSTLWWYKYISRLPARGKKKTRNVVWENVQAVPIKC